MNFATTRNRLIHQSTKNILFNIVLCSLCIILTVTVAIIIYALMVALLLYKLLIILILRIQYKQNYGGLLNCADAIWVLEDEGSRSVINFLFLVQFDKSKRNLTEYVKEICSKRFLKSPRLTCIRKEFMGYVCLVENQLTVDDIVRDMITSSNDVCDVNTLQRVLQDYSNKPLPKDDTATWELLIGHQPVKLQGLEDKEDQYPLLMRMHHSVGDGVTFLSLLIRNISDEGTSVLQKNNGDSSEPQSYLNKLTHCGIKTWRRTRALLQAHAYLIPIVKPVDANLLHRPVLSGEKRMGFYIESRPKYLEAVRKLKTRLPGATFSDVMYTAISASLDTYFQKHSGFSPKEVTLTFIAVTDRNDLKYMHDKLGNIFSMGFINLPINVSARKSALLDRFTKTQREHKKSSQSHDLLMTNFQLQTFADLLPFPMLKLLLKSNDISTVAFSNLPGFRKIHISGQSLNHLLFWVPNYQSTGVGFSIITYDDRFHMGLMVDKVLISDEEQVQHMLNDILKNIDLLSEEFEIHNNTS